MSELALEALPQAAHVGVTLLVDGKLRTSVFTHPEVPEIDRAQYRTGEGPCIDAYRESVPHLIASTLEPGRWQAFRDAAAEHGVRSTMSLPMLAHAGAIGALNMYAETERAFDEHDAEVGMLFATQAAFLLLNAQAYWDARTLSENLEQAMASRATIEQAKGIIMGSVGCGPDEAIAILIRQSQHENTKLRDVAAALVRNTARRKPIT